MQQLQLPAQIEAVFREFRTCEFTTLAKDGTPTTWPTAFYYQPEKNNIFITTSIGFPQKAYNIRRNPRVSLFLSNPTACGLQNPAAVLVQGDAVASDDIVASPKGHEPYWRMLAERQPAHRSMSAAYMRPFIDWYYMRIHINVTPRRILWWPEANFNQPAQVIEVSHVG